MGKSRRRKRKNRKIKFSEINYVENTYMKDGKAVIPIKVKNIQEIYVEHDYKKVDIADELCSYIEEIAFMIPVHVDIVLEIHCQEISKELQNKIRRNIRNNYGMEIDDNDSDIRQNNEASLIMVVIGILLLILNIYTSNLGELWSEILTVMWWVPLWNLIEIQFMDNKELRSQRLNNQQLYDSKIEFVFDDGINSDLDDIFNE
jgi:hypothetical protein